MSKPKNTEVLILGAGLSGLSCAHDLTEAGLEVTVVDKGRGLGGRLANRRIGEATFDHGAQFFTARDPRFQKLVVGWQKQGLVTDWYRSVPGQEGETVRWRAVPTMTALAKNLAKNLFIERQSQAVSVHAERQGWRVHFKDGAVWKCQSLVLTAPVPQTLALLKAGEVSLEPALQQRLEGIVYDPCIAVMAVLDSPSDLPREGAVCPKGGSIRWMADNQMKGVSQLPALTLHATPEFSRQYWELDREQAGQMLLNELPQGLREKVVEFQVHGWKFSQPVDCYPASCLAAQSDPLLVLAGDAFNGPRVEGAVCSGWAAAAAILDRIKR